MKNIYKSLVVLSFGLFLVVGLSQSVLAVSPTTENSIGINKSASFASSFTVPTPVITSVRSKSYSEGTINSNGFVDLKGTGLKGSLTVMIGNSKVSVESKSNITVQFPSPALSAGQSFLTVTNGGKTSKKYRVNIITPETQKPTITTITPNKATAGIPITISGTNLSKTAVVQLRKANSAMVEFKPSSISDTQVVFTVDAGYIEKYGLGSFMVNISTVKDCLGGCRSDSNSVSLELVGIPSITITSPNGGEVWPVGSKQKITWKTKNIVSPNDKITIYLIPDGGPNRNIGQELPNIGSYDYLVDDPTKFSNFSPLFKIGSQFKLGICVKKVGINSLCSQASDHSDNFFTIVANYTVPTITTLTPNSSPVKTKIKIIGSNFPENSGIFRFASSIKDGGPINGDILVGGQRIDKTRFNFIIPSAIKNTSSDNLTKLVKVIPGKYFINFTGPTGNSNKVQFIVTPDPIVEFTKPLTLTLQLVPISNQEDKDSFLVGTTSLTITGDSADIYKESIANIFDLVSENFVGRTKGTRVDVNEVKPSVLTSLPSRQFEVSLMAPTKELFAGSYVFRTVSPLNYGQKKSIPVPLKISNSVSIIGETSPYITKITTSSNTNSVSLQGVRFDQTSNTVTLTQVTVTQVGASKVVSRTLISSNGIINFDMTEDFGITTLGEYQVQVTTKDGASNIVTSVIGSPSLTVTKNPNYPDQTVSPNTVGAKIGSFILENKSSSEAVQVTSLKVALNGTSSLTNFASLRIVDSGIVVGDPIQPSLDNVFPVSLTLAPRTKKTLDILTDIATATGSVSTVLKVISIGAMGNIPVVSALVNGQTITLVSPTIGADGGTAPTSGTTTAPTIPPLSAIESDLQSKDLASVIVSLTKIIESLKEFIASKR